MKSKNDLSSIFFTRNAFIALVIIFELSVPPLWGQVVHKRKISVSDYPKWSELRLKEMSADGKWLSYALHYQTGIDTLFIRSTKTSIFFRIPNASNSDFIGKDWFVSLTGSVLHILNLQNGRQEIVKNVIKYIYSAKSEFLIILVKPENSENELIIRTLQSNIVEKIPGVTEFISDPLKQTLLYAVQKNKISSINILELSNNRLKTVVTKEIGAFNQLVWGPREKKVCAFLHTKNDSLESDKTLNYYNIREQKLIKSGINNRKSFLGDSLRLTNLSYKIKISDDGEKVFFMMKKRLNQKNDRSLSDVQLWNGNAKWIYPMYQKQKHQLENYLAVWRPMEDTYTIISNDIFPQFMLTGDQNYAILSNVRKYEPEYTMTGLTDFYILNIKTGENKLILKKHSAHPQNVIASPDGKFISYFKDKNWWVYDIKKDVHINLTKVNDNSFFQNRKEQPNNEEPYTQIGWTPNDNEILLYDTYDIWAFSPDGSTSRRLTHGREIQTQFRLAEHYARIGRGQKNYNGLLLDPVNLKIGQPLFGKNENTTSGYYWFSNKENKLVAQTVDSRLDQIIYSKNGNVTAFRQQRYDMSPRIMLQSKSKSYPKILLKSNPQQEHFYWGKSELVNYRNTKGKALKSILYYPANYDPQKKYPMIVYIYEKLSENLHVYINPSEYTGDGQFNISTFTTQDYFVLAPDISYETGNPGVSAVDCVVSATEEILKKGIINKNKIGLIGHSFGGYQVGFIITQTNLFAAAVSGSSISDLTSFYLSAGTASGKPEVWRFESQQWRMGKSLFENRDGYDMNSPIVHAQNIETPLFSWTGDSDKQLPSQQSIEFYLALRRLQKKQIMAVYPHEDHTLTNKINQKDLSIRLHQWFDFYLKDLPPEKWIKEGIN